MPKYSLIVRRSSQYLLCVSGPSSAGLTKFVWLHRKSRLKFVSAKFSICQSWCDDKPQNICKIHHMDVQIRHRKSLGISAKVWSNHKWKSKLIADGNIYIVSIFVVNWMSIIGRQAFGIKCFLSIEKFNGKLAIIKTSPLILVKSAPMI